MHGNSDFSTISKSKVGPDTPRLKIGKISESACLLLSFLHHLAPHVCGCLDTAAGFCFFFVTMADKKYRGAPFGTQTAR